MKFIKNIANEIAEQEALVESIRDEARDLVAWLPVTRIGLFEDYTPGQHNTILRKGDIVLDANEKRVYVATGDEHNGKPVIANKFKKRVIEPEFVTVGAMVADPHWKRVAGKIAMDHAGRRVLVYGELPKKGMMEATSNLNDNPISKKDKGIPSWFCAPKAQKDTTKGAKVSNDKKPYESSMKKAGKVTKRELGDLDPGNAPVAKKTAKKKATKKGKK